MRSPSATDAALHRRAVTTALWALLAAALSIGTACAPRAPVAGERIAHPDDPSRSIEFFLERPGGTGPWPTVVLLHGHQPGSGSGGADFVRWGVLRQIASRGYLAVAVSQPGYGGSAGPRDFSGPGTVRAVAAVIAHLRQGGLASPERIVIQGISRGAITAGLVAAEDEAIAGLVLISGAHDLHEYVRQPEPSTEHANVVAALVAETGGEEAALDARSLMRAVDRIRAPTLVLNGGKDERTSAAQAQRFAAALRERGVNAQAIIYPEHGHRIPVEVRARDVDPFIERVLRAR